MKKTLLWRAMFLAASLSSVMSVGASPFEREESSRRAPIGHLRSGAGEKRKATSLREDTKTPKKTRGDDLSTQEESSQAPFAIAGEVIQDPSLGDLVVLPKEVLGLVFSKLGNPLVMRKVSTATKAVVDHYFSLRMPVFRVDSFMRQRQENPSFFQEVRIALEGWTHNPEKLIKSLPQGTTFRKGDLRFYGNVPPSLPVTIKSTVVVESNAERAALLTAGVREGANVLSLEEEWRKFLDTPFMMTLHPFKREAVLFYKKSLMFLLGLAHGHNTLKLLISQSLGEHSLPSANQLQTLDHYSWDFYSESMKVDAEYSFSVFDLFGTTKEKLNVIGAMSPKIFDKAVGINARKHVLESVAAYPDQDIRMQIASRIQPYMMRFDRLVYDSELSGRSYFQEILPLICDLDSDFRFIDKMNIRSLYRNNLMPSYFGPLVACLAKLPDPESAMQIAPLITVNFGLSFVEYIKGSKVCIFHSDDLEAILRELAGLKTQKAREEMISLLDSEPVIGGGKFLAFFQDVARDSFFADLVHNLDLKSLSQICKNPKATLSVLKGLAALQDEKLAKVLVRTLRVSFVEAFRHKNDHLSHENQLVCFGDLQGAVTELGRIEPTLRSRVSSLITMDFLNRLYVEVGDEEKGALAVRVAQALFMIEDQTTRDHLYNALTPSFFKAIASHESLKLDALNQVISALAKIQSPEIRGRAITLLGDQADAQMQGPISAIDFLEMLASKTNENLQNAYLYLYE